MKLVDADFRTVFAVGLLRPVAAWKVSYILFCMTAPVPEMFMKIGLSAWFMGRPPS